MTKHLEGEAGAQLEEKKQKRKEGVLAILTTVETLYTTPLEKEYPWWSKLVSSKVGSKNWRQPNFVQEFRGYREVLANEVVEHSSLKMVEDYLSTIVFGKQQEEVEKIFRPSTVNVVKQFALSPLSIFGVGVPPALLLLAPILLSVGFSTVGAFVITGLAVGAAAGVSVFLMRLGFRQCKRLATGALETKMEKFQAGYKQFTELTREFLEDPSELLRTWARLSREMQQLGAKKEGKTQEDSKREIELKDQLDKLTLQVQKIPSYFQVKEAVNNPNVSLQAVYTIISNRPSKNIFQSFATLITLQTIRQSSVLPNGDSVPQSASVGSEEPRSVSVTTAVVNQGTVLSATEDPFNAYSFFAGGTSTGGSSQELFAASDVAGLATSENFTPEPQKVF